MPPTSNDIALIVCDTEANALNRQSFLTSMGFSNTTIETVKNAIGYDALQFGGGVMDAPDGKWLVIGRKP